MARSTSLALLACAAGASAFAPSHIAQRASSAAARPRARPAAAATALSANARVAILGASGYTGAELCRMLIPHPHVDITIMTANSLAGKSMGEVFPQYAYGNVNLPDLVKADDVTDAQWAECDVAFCCLPHATTQKIIKELPETVRVVDLSADFRLFDTDVYEKWYGLPHAAVELQKEAVYGLTELARDAVKTARLVANPGCYPTAAQLPLIPLLEQKLILTSDIIIDAKSGATGMGRAPSQAALFCEVADGVHAYGVGAHRHAPEIEQGLSGASGDDVIINFTPHLMPMSRGIFESIYVKLADGVTAADLKAALAKKYKDEPFVHVLETGNPQTRHVRGTNNCIMQVVEDRVPGRAIILSAIDNVAKGASGQAVQNMNVMLGFEETTGLQNMAFFP